MGAYRRGFVLHMWTGLSPGFLFPVDRFGQPRLFKSAASAARHLARYPAWCHAAVTLYEAWVRPGSNGRPDYLLGDAVADFPHELDLATGRAAS